MKRVSASCRDGPVGRAGSRRLAPPHRLEHRLRLLDRFAVELSDEAFVAAPHDQEHLRVAVAQVSLLVRHVGSEVGEIAFADLGDVLQPLALFRLAERRVDQPAGRAHGEERCDIGSQDF